MTTIVSGSSITFNDNTTQNTSAYGGGFAMRNRIINGDMRIDQRNAGASVTGTTAYAVDRFATRISGGGGGVLTVQRSTTVPTSQGFVNSLFLQATTADTSIGAAEAYWIQQRIEGFNTADFGFGAANASTVTLSFWVRSSVTGTYSTVLQNSAGNRSYVSEYTISAANTWEYKTITITGDTSGTWLTDNGIGVSVLFCLAVGSTYQQTANSWGTVSFATGSPNQVNFMNTLNSTFYITGVQLEKGSTATSFDYRPYGQELALCQRYYYRIKSGATGNVFGSAWVATTTVFYVITQFPVTMRISPTALEQSGTAGDYAAYHGGTVTTCSIVPAMPSSNLMSTMYAFTDFSVASGLTIGQAGYGRAVNTSAYLGWSAEL